MAKRTKKRMSKKNGNGGKPVDPDKTVAVQRAEAALAKALEQAAPAEELEKAPETPTAEEVLAVKRRHLQRGLRRATKSAQSLNRMLKALAKSIEE